jgi:hypothetical protein
VVSSDGATTTIEPAQPDVVYVPAYDPNAVYGAWLYPDYPPYYFPFSPGYGAYYGGGIGFAFAITVISPLWGWDHCDWRRHRIRLDPDRYNALHGGARVRPRPGSETWEHDPLHRRGVAYRDPVTQQRFLGAREPGHAESRRAFRGFDAAAPVGAPPRPMERPTERPLQRPAPRQEPVRAAPPRALPAFGDIDRGRDARRDGERGRASRATVAPPLPRSAPQPSAAPRQVQPHRSGGGERRPQR